MKPVVEWGVRHDGLAGYAVVRCIGQTEEVAVGRVREEVLARNIAGLLNGEQPTRCCFKSCDRVATHGNPQRPYCADCGVGGG